MRTAHAAVGDKHGEITIITAEKEFDTELKVFEGEVNEATQCFYMWDSIHNIARDRRVYDAINRFAPFWNAIIRSLQANSLIALGRIFDTDSRSHSVSRLLKVAETNAVIFSKSSLEKRKRSIGGNVNEWIDEFMKDRYVPNADDFRNLRQYVSGNRLLYEKKYGPLRNKYFAHKDRIDVTGLFANTDVRELQHILVSLRRVHDWFWQLFTDGHKYDLRRGRYSTKQILKMPKHKLRNNDEQEWITGTTKTFFEYLKRK